VAVAAVVVALAAPARAQDALRGKRLYLDTARLVGGGVSCVDCHGGLPGGLHGIGGAAGDPTRIAEAVEAIPQMAPLRGRLVAADLEDLAAYLGDPAVPSPQITVTTVGPDGAAGAADRLDFGAVAVGARSAVAVVMLANTGARAFRLTEAPRLEGSAAAELSLRSSGCAAGAIVEPQATCRFELQLHPSGAPGPRTARLVVAHDWIGGATAVALLGRTAEDEPSSAGCSGGAGGGGAGGVLVVLVAVACGLGPATARRPRARASSPRRGTPARG
jgi:hypothetical protein